MLIEPLARHAVRQAQPEDEALRHHLARGQPLPALDAPLARERRGPPAGLGALRPVPERAEGAVGAGAEPDVVRPVPVAEVVAGAPAGPREVRDLVPREARRRGALDQRVELGDLEILVGNPRGRAPAEGGGGLEREGVRGEVIRRPGERLVERPRPGGQVLAGARVEEVDADVLEPRRARRPVGVGRVGRGVRAPEAPEERVVERLDAERQARHPGGAERAQTVPIEPLGVGLERDLGVRREPEPGAGVGHHRRDGRGRQERRGAAAEEQGRRRHPARPGQRRVALRSRRGARPRTGRGGPRGGSRR